MVLRVASEASHDPKHSGFPYQIDALRAIEALEYAAIFHEPGLGKTKIAIDLALSWLRNKAVDSVLIVCKRSLVANWVSESRIHSHLYPLILSQNRKSNHVALNSPGRLYLTHYEVCKTELARLKLFVKTRRVAVICDEAQKLKNPTSTLFRAFIQLRDGFVRRVILTGTPIANRPYDIWGLIYFLDGGVSLGTNFAEFRRAFNLSAEVATDPQTRVRFEESLSRLFKRIQKFTVRETKRSAQIILPDKIVENVLVDPEELQDELYGVYRKEARAAVEKFGTVSFDDIDEILKRLLRLVQVASNPRLVTDAYRREPGKLPILRNLLLDVKAQGSKAIVWTSFVENARWLVDELREFGTCVVHGRMGIDERNAALGRFKSQPETQVLVATPGSAKEGLTLTVANVAIFFDRTFSLDDYLQAQDRIHRISQEKTCYIYNLLLRDSIDVWVDELLTAKHLAAQLGQGDIDPERYRERATYHFAEVLESILGHEGSRDQRE
jgi:SNF2 family DNA or RNA helicase